MDTKPFEVGDDVEIRSRSNDCSYIGKVAKVLTHIMHIDVNVSGTSLVQQTFRRDGLPTGPTHYANEQVFHLTEEGKERIHRTQLIAEFKSYVLRFNGVDFAAIPTPTLEDVCSHLQEATELMYGDD
jgi:hypothetical protein